MKISIVTAAVIAIILHGLLLSFLFLNFDIFNKEQEKKTQPVLIHATVVDLNKMPNSPINRKKAKALAEEKKRQAEEARKKAIAEENRRKELERIETEKKIALEKKKAEAEKQKKLEEEKKKKEELEKQKKLEEEKKKKEELEKQKKLEEEKKKKEELEKQKKLEEEKKRKLKEAEDDLFSELDEKENGNTTDPNAANNNQAEAIKYGVVVQTLIKSKWKIDTSMNGKNVKVSIQVGAHGEITNPSCVGDSKVCESALNAIKLIAKLPPPPDNCSDCRKINLNMTAQTQ
ncbi:MAG: cell envelope integrity protein TolA [Succinivibrionaceae bacterium]